MSVQVGDTDWKEVWTWRTSGPQCPPLRKGDTHLSFDRKSPDICLELTHSPALHTSPLNLPRASARLFPLPRVFCPPPRYPCEKSSHSFPSSAALGKKLNLSELPFSRL